MVISWSIAGADGEVILGDTHMPTGASSGVVVIARGFKGYKDYGMFPRLANEFADAGLIAHRFNFSHSGMTNDLATFARPDLFERDTWSKQTFDLLAVLAAIDDGRLAGGGARDGGSLSRFVLGHSRGGVAALLAAARLTYPGTVSDIAAKTPGLTPESPGSSAGVPRSLATTPTLAGIITLAAPASCDPLTAVQLQELLEQGWIESPSSRTGQRLRVGRAFVQEQLDDPANHDLLGQIARIGGPILVIHGECDSTVPAADAHAIARAARGRAHLHLIPDADHVFNTPNPLPDDAPTSPQLQAVIEESLRFIREHSRSR